MTEPIERCCWGGCKNPADMLYLDRALCNRCWGRVCDLSSTSKAKHLAKMLGLPLERISETVDAGTGEKG